MSLPLHLALVPRDVAVPAADLMQVAAALSKQIARDFAPLWGVVATVDAFANLQHVPIDYIPLIVVPDVKDAAGYHQSQNGQPFALIEYGPGWSVTASHEALELLADPWGNRLRAGDLLQEAVDLGLTPGRVNYLVEVCDPSEAAAFTYSVNGIPVSDFLTPHYYDPAGTSGQRYSFTGAISRPRQVLPGGYITWQSVLDQQWCQLRMFADAISPEVPHLVNLSSQTNFGDLAKREGLRAASDRVTTPAVLNAQKREQTASLGTRGTERRAAAGAESSAAEEAASARSSQLNQEVDALLA